jgi:hypothetical protein
MPDDHTENEPTQRNRPAPDIAFQRAMAEVEAGCKSLRFMIDQHDFEGVEYEARRAVNIWRTGHAAYRRYIVRVGGPGPSTETDGTLLEARRASLLALFEQARRQIAVPRMHKVLDELRTNFAATVMQPQAETIDEPQ